MSDGVSENSPGAADPAAKRASEYCGAGAGLIARDRERLLGSVGFAASGQGAAIVAGLLCMVLTTRLLGPSGYGRLAMFFLFLEILSQIIGWPNLGLVRFGRAELAKDGRIAATFWARVALFFASLVAVAALLFAFRRPLDAYLGLEYPPHILLLLYVALNEAVFLLRGAFQTVGDFRWYAVSTGAVRTFNFLFILGAFVIIAWQPSVAGIIWAHIASIGLVVALCAAFLPWRQLMPARLRASAVRDVFHYSWPVIAVGFSWIVVNWIDLVVIKHYFPTGGAVGLYAVAYQPVTMLTALQVAALGAVLPLVVSLAIEKRCEALRWYLDEGLTQAAWLLGLAFTLAAAASEAIPLVFGKGYAGSVAPCQVLMAGLGLSVFAALQALPAQALDRTRALAGATVVLAALNLGLDLLLVPRVGVVGAAMATSAAFAAETLLLVFLLNSIGELRSPRARRRYGAILGLHPVILMAAFAANCARPELRLLAAGALVLLWVGLAKASGVFRMDTLDRLRDVRMPAWARAGAAGFFAFFARRGIA